MGWQFWTVAGVAAAFLALAATLVVLLARERRRRRDDLAALRDQVDALAARLEPAAPAAAQAVGADPEFVITRVGEPEPRVLSDRVVLSATLGEPLVRVVAFGHGVRRALSPEARHRIRFEVRREVKRSRKVRRREMREAWRAQKAEERAGSRVVVDDVPAPEQRRDVA